MLEPCEKSSSHNLHIVAGEVQFPTSDAALESLSRVKIPDLSYQSRFECNECFKKEKEGCKSFVSNLPFPIDADHTQAAKKKNKETLPCKRPNTHRSLFRDILCQYPHKWW